jgi:hypothetical protein
MSAADSLAPLSTSRVSTLTVVKWLRVIRDKLST